MDDPRWLRLITIGLVLAAMAVGYFLISGRFSANSSTRQQTQVNKAVSSPAPTIIPVATPSSSSLSLVQNSQGNSGSAYNRIVSRTQGGVQVLPRTGFPIVLVGIFSMAAMISGWGLRKFPN